MYPCISASARGDRAPPRAVCVCMYVCVCMCVCGQALEVTARRRELGDHHDPAAAAAELVIREVEAPQPRPRRRRRVGWRKNKPAPGGRGSGGGRGAEEGLDARVLRGCMHVRAVYA